MHNPMDNLHNPKDNLSGGCGKLQAGTRELRHWHGRRLLQKQAEAHEAGTEPEEKLKNTAMQRNAETQ